MSLKKLIVRHFVLTAAPPDSIWLATAAIHRLGLLGESAATMRKTIPPKDGSAPRLPMTAQTEVDAMVFIDEADIAIAVERHG